MLFSGKHTILTENMNLILLLPNTQRRQVLFNMLCTNCAFKFDYESICSKFLVIDCNEKVFH